MCGICGIFFTGETAGRVDATVLARMRDTMRHRGPDGEGLWIARDGRTGLGHRRLAILDLSPLAAQPMSNEDGTIWVTYNGEIYNHAALRTELLEAGHRFRTDHSDTEVVVHAYEQWGTDCVERFDGMFAFGIWDGGRGRLFLARDRLGVKPLYICFRPGVALFGSEIKAILAHPSVTAAVSPAAMYHYLSFLTAPAPLTMFDGIFKVPAGCGLCVERGGEQRMWRYWDAVPRESDSLRELTGLSPAAQEEFCVRQIRELLSQAVQKRMMSDVPFGVLLSGGIDSSTNVALMSRFMDRPVETFTVGYRDHTWANELEPARRVSRAFGTNHHEVLIGEREAQDYVPDLIYHQDEPLADWACIPLAFVSRLARESGTIVVQVGEGSDEQFCGYDHFVRYLRIHRRYWGPFRLLPDFVRRPIATVGLRASDLFGRGRFYADILDRGARDRELFWGGAVVFGESEKARLVRRERFRGSAAPVPASLRAFAPDSFFRPDSFGVIAEYLREFDQAFPSADVLTRMAYLECKLRLPELLLMRVDKITMSTSVEARVPFLDYRLVEFTMGIPMSLKVKRDVPKYLLKKACEGIIPDDVIHRTKMGFGVPMREWLRGDFGRRIESVILNSPMRSEGYLNYDGVADLFRRQRAGRDLSLPIWTLFNLTAWFDHWIAGRRAAA
jgi:asparagine synthase (glutamine-hydrolysing)